MPDHALNAPMMPQTMRDRMQRDPGKVKQNWRFIWRTNRQVPHDELISQVVGHDFEVRWLRLGQIFESRIWRGDWLMAATGR